MSFKLKTLVAAAILASSGAANAAINHAAGGDLFVLAFDSGTQNTYIKVLSDTIADATAFNGSSFYSVDMTTDANWTSFLSQATGSVTYSVLGLDTSVKSFWETSNLTVGGNNNVYNNISPIPGTVDTWLNKFAPNNGSTNSSLVPISADTVAIDGVYTEFNNNWATKGNGATDAALGTSLNFYKFTKNGTLALNTMTKTTYESQWTLNNSTLTYGVAPVPEADSWMMMLAGLGLMGFIARRRVGA